MVNIVPTDEFTEWFEQLDDADSDAVTRVVGLLERTGPLLRHPHSTRIVTSKHAVRELRTQAQGRPLRVFYAFDHERQAVLLIGGDKTGDDRFYEKFTPKADAIFERHLEAMARAAAEAAKKHPK